MQEVHEQCCLAELLRCLLPCKGGLQSFRLMGRMSVPDVLLIRMNPTPHLCGKGETLERNVLNCVHCLRQWEQGEIEHLRILNGISAAECPFVCHALVCLIASFH